MSDLEIKRKKLKMRSMRRGTKEMDLILKNFSKLRLDFMTEEELELYEKLLSENDQDLYQWCTGQSCAKQEFETLIIDIKDFISESGGLNSQLFRIFANCSNYQCPVFSIDNQGSAGSSEFPACKSSIDILSGDLTNAILPSRGGRLMITLFSIKRVHIL